VPSSPRAIALTDAYRARLLDTRLRTAKLTAQAWAHVEPGRLEETGSAFVATTRAVVENAKREGVARADGYLAAYLAAELATEVRPRGIDPEPYLDTEDGRPLTRALTTPLLLVTTALRQGRLPEDALQLGRARATRIVAAESLGAPRRALGDLLREEDRVTGWRRVPSRNACGACLALASGEARSKADLPETHGCCRCTAEPVVRGVRERIIRPTGREIFDAYSHAEQAALFHGRGGAEKAELIRSGAVPFDALIQRDEMAVTSDQFTEAPLAALAELATGQGATP
jgi:hypothetical protein